MLSKKFFDHNVVYSETKVNKLRFDGKERKESDDEGDGNGF